MVLFTGTLARIQRKKVSGSSLKDEYELAKKAFAGAKGKTGAKFKLFDTWLLVKDMAKFDPDRFFDSKLAKHPSRNFAKDAEKKGNKPKKLTPSKAIKRRRNGTFQKEN